MRCSAQTYSNSSDLSCHAVPGEAGKKIRTLQKKLRQIEEIKKKASDAGGEGALPPAQREKLGQEAALRKELEELNKTL
jgi:hypothetical protein